MYVSVNRRQAMKMTAMSPSTNNSAYGPGASVTPNWPSMPGVVYSLSPAMQVLVNGNVLIGAPGSADIIGYTQINYQVSGSTTVTSFDGVWVKTTSNQFYALVQGSSAWLPISQYESANGPVVNCAPTPAGTTITGASVITDNWFNTWGINTKGQVTVDGFADTTTARVTKLATDGLNVYQENASGDWWWKPRPVSAWTSIDPNSGTVHVNGTATYNVAQIPGITPNTVNDVFLLDGHSNLILTDSIQFGSLITQGGAVTLGGSGTSQAVTLNSSVTGNSIYWNQGTLTINGSVSAGVILEDCALNATVARMTLDQPLQFHGTVGIGPTYNQNNAGVYTTNGESDYIALMGLNADSYSIKGDILSLYNGNKLIDTLTFQNNTFPDHAGGERNAGTMTGLSVEHNTSGVMIASASAMFGGYNADASQPGGVGIALTVHS
jgi:hypothetical protein